jgi:hypothetical protein
MNRTLTARCRVKYWVIATLAVWSIVMVADDVVRAQDYSGLSLKLYGNDPANTTNEYSLESEPLDPGKNYTIQLLLVLKNISNQKINTKRGFSQVELYRALKVKDPCGIPLELTPDESAFATSAGIPRFVGGRPLIPAEVLQADFARSLKISDLRKLFPVMYELPGAYKVAAQLLGARFFLTEYSPERGLEGFANHFSNWFGTIDATVGLEEQLELAILILPDSGGHLKVQIEKQDAQTIQPLFGIPVKAFAGSIAQDPAIVWEATDVAPVLTGITGISGEVKWDCDKCLSQGVYTILAQHQDEIQAIEITESDDSGWGEKCSGLIERTILFKPPPLMMAGKFSIFGLDSVEIGKQAVVLSGDIGVNAAGAEPKHKHKSSYGVKINQSAELEEGVSIYADRVRIEKDAVVYDVYYNELENKGQILGEMITPLALPVWEPPVFLESSPGKKNIKVKGKKGKKDKKGRKDKKDHNVVELAAGAYDKVEIDDNGELHLLGGTYHFSSMKLDKHASLIFLGPATILIEEGLDGHDEIYIGPDANSGISAADIVFYIGGIEEKHGKKKGPKPKVKKVAIGKKSKVVATIYAPNSTLKIEKESEVQGSFIAAEVIVEDKATVAYNSAF